MSKVRMQRDRIIWIDCEMTGLDKDHDALIEIAALVTDFDLHILGEGVDLVIKPPAAAVEQMGDFVRNMHESSGLLAELNDGISLAQAEAQVLDYVRTWAPTAGAWPLAGNSVGTDRAFINRDMPTLGAHMNYRTIDVSTIKELAHRWYPRAYFHAPDKHGNHRALADIRESISELRYYRETVFVPQPGPDSLTAAATGKKHDSP